MKNKVFFFLTILGIFSYKTFAQKVKTKEIIEKKEIYTHIDVIKVYERVAQKGYKSVDLFQKLGNNYYENFELDKAARWYGELFAITSELEPKYFYQYALSLKYIGQIDKANEMLDKFNLKSKQVLENKIKQQ